MVDVTEKNFTDLRPVIEQELRSANFVALDTEFTCLLAEDKYSNKWFDSGKERYHKLRANLDQVAICQLGITICKSVPNSNRYECTVYNIFVRPTAGLDHDSNILCQASSLAFLAHHGFDFNKWLYDGVTCLNRSEHAAVRQQLDGLRERTSSTDFPIEVRDELRNVLEWASTAPLGTQYKVLDQHNADISSTTSFRDPLSTPLLIAAVHNTCPDLHASVDQHYQMIIEKVGAPERKSLEARIEREFERLSEGCLDWLTGCSHLLWLMAELRVPIVLHNGLIDAMLLHKQFFSPLPATLEQFKHSLTTKLPTLYDTKLIASHVRKQHSECDAVREMLHQTNLAMLAAALQQSHVVLFKPAVAIKQHDNKYESGSHLHEAGYDSFLTACCFLQLAHLQCSLNITSYLLRRPMEAREHLAAFRDLANKLNVIRGAVQYLNLSGPDPEMGRPPWLIVERLPWWKPSTKPWIPTDGLNETRLDEASTATVYRKPGTTEGSATGASATATGATATGATAIGVTATGATAAPLLQFTPESVAAMLSRFGSVDVRPWRRNKLLVAVASRESHKSILMNLRVPNIRISQYNPVLHSWLLRGVLWTGFVTSGGLSIALLYSCFKSSRT